MAGLVIGKTIGFTATTWLVARFTRATLDEGLSWTDVVGLAMLGGLGFTVSLLIGELAFGTGNPREDHVKIAALAGSLIAALLASVVLRLRDRVYRRIHAAESVDTDCDGVPDMYKTEHGRALTAGGFRKVTAGSTVTARCAGKSGRQVMSCCRPYGGSDGRCRPAHRKPVQAVRAAARPR